ncbi:uncharacterized protein [Littorina saxatilis]|uniref:Uncharacterized protein n=1 Tax=Littorina saxatilis TaxID=31220 RepID=A0AAN9ALZ2_9CAEN
MSRLPLPSSMLKMLLLLLLCVWGVQCGSVVKANGTFVVRHGLSLQTARCSARDDLSLGSGVRVISIDMRRDWDNTSHVTRVSTRRGLSTKDHADRLRCHSQGNITAGILTLTCLQSPPFDMTMDNLRCDYEYEQNGELIASNVVVSLGSWPATVFVCTSAKKVEGSSTDVGDLASLDIELRVGDETLVFESDTLPARDVLVPCRGSTGGGRPVLCLKREREDALRLTVLVAADPRDTDTVQWSDAKCRRVQVGNRFTLVGTLSPPAKNSSVGGAQSGIADMVVTSAVACVIGVVVSALLFTAIVSAIWCRRRKHRKGGQQQGTTGSRTETSDNDCDKVNMKRVGEPLLDKDDTV